MPDKPSENQKTTGTNNDSNGSDNAYQDPPDLESEQEGSPARVDVDTTVAEDNKLTTDLTENHKPTVEAATAIKRTPSHSGRIKTPTKSACKHHEKLTAMRKCKSKSRSKQKLKQNGQQQVDNDGKDEQGQLQLRRSGRNVQPVNYRESRSYAVKRLEFESENN